MVVIENYTIAMLMCVVTMLCWGSWANTQKLAGRRWWSFQLFYWDYALGVVLMTLLFALSMGSIGDQGRHFFADLLQSNVSSIFLAAISGVIFNLANILLVAAIDLAGMAVAFPIAVGLALVIGVLTNYMANPIGNVWWLFSGVALVFLAIILDAVAYRCSANKVVCASAKSIVIAVISGILMGYFYRFLAVSMSFDFITPAVGKMTPYSAAFVFSLGLFVSNFVINTVVMRWPFSGDRVYYKDYFQRGDLVLHGIGLLGGAIWTVGLVFSLLAAGPAGYAISYGLGQGATLVAALWGVFVWKEFVNASLQVKCLLFLMFVLYVLGLMAIIFSRNY